MGTFDQLIISMGIHLVHIHGEKNVIILTSDDRLSNILNKCKKGIPPTTVKKLKLENCEILTGKKFRPETFTSCINLKTASNKDLEKVLGEWPLKIGKVSKKVYRYNK